MRVDRITHERTHRQLGSGVQDDMIAREGVGVRTDAYRLARAMLLVLFASAIDVFSFLDNGGSFRYAILLVPIGVSVLILARTSTSLVRRPATTDRVLLLLWLFGMSGTLYGVFVLQAPTSARPIFFPMSIAFLYLLVADTPTDKEVERLLRAVAWIGAIYVVLVAIVNLGFIHVDAFNQSRNAKLAVEAMGLSGALVLRKRGRFAALVCLALFNFLVYPSATSLLVTLAALLTLFVTSPRSSGLRLYLVGALVAMGVLFALVNMSRGITVLNDYFASVGKSNSNDGRLSLWVAGVDQWKQSPFIGQAFAGGTVTTTYRLNGPPVPQVISLPYHNDYVLFLAQGGIVAFGLLIVWIILVEVMLVRRYQGFLLAGQRARADLLRVILVGLNSFLVAAAFNPVFGGASRSATIFGLYVVAMLLGRPAPPREASVGAVPSWVANSKGA